jgi:hypothetical protein
MTGIYRAELEWTATTEAERFFRYRVQRSDARHDWQDVAWLTDEAVTHFEDYEALRAVASSWRMTVERTDGARAPWTSPATNIIPATRRGSWAFVTNESPDLNIETLLADGPLRFRPQRRSRTVEYFGRPLAFVHRDPLFRGDDFTLDVLYDETAGGRDVFDALEELAAAPLRYVRVLAPDGRGWYANIQVDEPVIADNGQTYMCRVGVRETGASSSTPSIAA